MTEVRKNARYLIVEKPVSGETPPEILREGRAKMVMGAKEYASPKWDEQTRSYDTGLRKTSKQFVGKKDEEILKTLEDRKELVEYFNQRLAAFTPDASIQMSPESQFLSDPSNKLVMFHNRIVDTSDVHEWFLLHNALQGNDLTPEKERGNTAKYGSSMYMLVDAEEKRNAKKDFADKKLEVQRWMIKTLEENPEQVLSVMRYHDLLTLDQKKEDSLLMDLVEKKIEGKDGADFLRKFLYTITSVPAEEVFAYNELRRMYAQQRIKKDSRGFYFEEVMLGESLQNAVKFLRMKENAEIYARIFNT